MDGGSTVDIRGNMIDNRWIVPYNPLLSHVFEAHINVEACHSVKSIKYICKYILKGTDLVTYTLEIDEINRYITGRYISSCEATWRLFGYDIHTHYPAVRKID